MLGKGLEIRAEVHPPDRQWGLPEMDPDRMAWDLLAYPDNRASRAGWDYPGDVEDNVFSLDFSVKVSV
jgi:hypothetical protein